MNTLQKTLAVLSLSIAGMSSASAHDSFSFGINIGGYGFAPPPVVHYYPAPATVYYGAPTVYYGAPVVRHYPAATYLYYDRGRHDFHGHRWGNRGGNFQHWGRGHDRGRHGGHR